jgi:quinone-modifying oxidoreductase, subunit QmoA
MGQTTGEVLIIGGGITGLSAAVEIAEFGHKVTIVEREASLGGRVSRIYKYFPKLCPPYCGLEIYYKRVRSNQNISFMTLAEVEKIEGTVGNFTASIKSAPRYVNGKCTGCNDCVDVCPVERPNDFNFGLNNSKAIYLPHELAFPLRYAIDDKVCPGEECGKCVDACKYDAIDLSMKTLTTQLHADAIIVATGWKPYDATKMDNLHFGDYKNVITNAMLERIASPNGPTKGNIVRPSDGKKVENVAFVQCAGSRDENHMPFCSSVCCLASLKQAGYVRDLYPEANIHLFYIDLRAPGRYEDFLQKMEKDEKLHLIKGKVAEIQEDPKSGNLTVVAEDIHSNKKYHETVDMVVLATGMKPSMSDEKNPFNVSPDKYGFFQNNITSDEGMYFAGCCTTPTDVSSCIKEANGVALKALQCIGRKENLNG